MRRVRKTLLILSIVSIIGGCGGSTVVVNDPSIPEALIDKIPLKVAGRYPDSFQHFVHEENIAGKEKWVIDLGASNQLLFSKLFNSMFTDYQVISADADPRDMGFDAVIEPSIDAFEFSVPNQTQTEEFAVWIRYRIKIFDIDGNQVANWPLSAYGKSQTGSFGGVSALHRAAVLAMRDAATLVIMQMDKATGISKLTAARDIKPVIEPIATPAAEDTEPGQTIAVEVAPNDQG